jgi:hypothetical protein
VAKLFWCLPTPTLTLATIPTTISTTSYNVSATYTPNTSGSATNEIQELQFNLYSAIGALLQTSGVVLYGEGVDLSYNFSGLEVNSTYYVTLDVTTTQGMNVSVQSDTFTVSIDTPTMGSASVVNNGCDGYISVTSNLSSEYEHEQSVDAGEVMSFTTESPNDIKELQVDFHPIQDGTPWMSSTPDTTPYLFRASPDMGHSYNSESDTIIGGTVAWNQLIKYPSSQVGSYWGDPSGGSTVTDNNGNIKITCTNIYSSNRLFSYLPKLPLNHVGFHSAYIKASDACSVGFNNKMIALPADVWKNINILYRSSSSSGYIAMLNYRPNNIGLELLVQNYIVIDLTAMFGSTIADYIYSLEQANAGAGVAWFRKLFPNDYYAYDAGSLVSVSGLESHDMVGKNLVNWTITESTFDSSFNGFGMGKWQDKFAIPACWAGKQMTYSVNLRAGSASNQCCRVWFYKDGTFISPAQSGNYIVANQTGKSSVTITIPDQSVANQIGLGLAVGGGTVASEPQIEFGSTATAYEPYVKHSYPLDSTLTLRGIPKLDNGKLYYDGDTYESDGTVTRKYGIVDLGSLNWAYNSSVARFATTGLENIAKKPSSNAVMGNILCLKYLTEIANYSADTTKDKIIMLASSGGLYVRDSSYTDAQDFKTAMSGVMLIYEKATPTTEIADPYTNPQIVDPSGTEEYVGSPIPVGHETTYQCICPISGWDSVEVDVVGKNLFGVENGTFAIGSTRELIALDGVLSYKVNIDAISATLLTQATINNCIVNKTLKEGTYTFKVETTAVDSLGLARLTLNLSDGTTALNGASFTLTESADIVSITSSVTENFYVGTYPITIQIEVGSTATPYEPYNGTTYTSTFPKYKQQVTQDKIPYVTKNIGDTYADTLTENLVGGTIAWNQSVPDTTTTHTVSGSIASMDDAVAGNFESVVCDIDLVQDLHGYDKPWVGGAGKNKIDQSAYTSLDATSYSNGIFTAETLSSFSSAMVRLYKNGASVDTLVKLVTEGSRVAFNVTVDDTWDSCFIGYRMGGQHNIGGVFNKPNVANGAYSVSFMVDKIPSESVYGIFSNIQFESGSTATTFEPWENLCPITGWTGCEVDVSGVNVWDEQTEQGTLSWTTGEKTWAGNAFRTKNYVPCAENKTYYVSAPVKSTTYLRFCFYDAQKQFLSATGWKDGGTTITTPVGCHFIMFAVVDGTTYQNNISINYPSTDTTYKAYNGQTYNITWQTEAGTVYGGSVDLVTGVLTVDNGKKTETTADVSLVSTSYTNIVYARFEKPSDSVDKGKGTTNILCSHFLADTTTSNLDDSGKIGHILGGAAYNYYWVGFPVGTTLAQAQSAIDGAELVYELATPITYQLDPVQVACLLGQNNVWINISDTIVTYPTNHSYQSLSTTHKYYKRINGVESISVGGDVVANVGTDNIIDLTQMFGTTIADYIYNIEQSSSSGMGVKFFKSLFPNDDYDYNSGTLISVNASAHVIKDANGNVLHTYPLDSDLVLRGIPKLDTSNKLYYDGDVYASSGNVTRKYGVVDLGTLSWNRVSVSGTSHYFFYAELSGGSRADDFSGINPKYPMNTGANWYTADETSRLYGSVSYGFSRVAIRDDTYTDAASFKTAMSGVYLVYELATTTTEQADPFEENQAIVSNGIEEYIVTEQGDVEMPVGHDSTYYTTAIYGGTVDMAKGVLTITHKVVDLGDLNYTKEITNWYTFFTQTIKNDVLFDANKATIMLTTYNGISQASTTSSGDNYAWVNPQGIVCIKDTSQASLTAEQFKERVDGLMLVYELATPIEISLTPQQMQTLSGQNNIWSNTNGGMYLVYQLPITALLVKRRDVADVSGKWLTLYSTPITQADDMDFTFIDFLNQYGKTYQYALVPVLEQDQSGVIVQIEGGYTVSDNVDSIFDGVYIADQTNVERVKAGVGYGNIDMNQGVGSITPIGSKYPVVITNSQNQYHNGSIRGTIVPNDFYSNGNLSRIDMVNKRDELEQFLTNKRAKIIKDWNGKMWLVMIMSNVACSFDDNYGMGMVSFSADWLEVGDPTNQQDLYNAGLINVGGV